MTGILEHLKWESLKKLRRDSRLILLYKGLKGKASIPTDDLIPLVRHCRNDHSMAYHVPIANTDIYKCRSPPPPPPPTPLRTGMLFQTLLSPLLKVQRMVLLSSLLWLLVLVNDCRSDVSPVNDSKGFWSKISSPLFYQFPFQNNLFTIPAHQLSENAFHSDHFLKKML